MKRIHLFIFILGLCASIAASAEIVNAKLESAAASGSLAQQVDAFAAKQSGPAWVGYSVGAIANHTMCCWDSGDWTDQGCCGTCHLEHHDGTTFNGTRDGCDNDSQGDAAVLYRLENKRVGSIRVFSHNCKVDAGGLPVLWIANVDPKQSVAYLSGFIGKDDEDRLGRKALDAIAMHDTRAADAALDRFVSAEFPIRLREHAAFWLGNSRGQHGYETLKKLAESEPDDKLREKLAFPLSQSLFPQAQDTLIDLAKHDSSPRVRKQALFWLAQKAGKKMAGVITDAIENDPDTDVKKHAVFALSQLPEHEGIPKLIEVAKNNHNPVVRKQAVFWLGQSDDPRAVDFITDVLTH
jgi:HEAT repeat protein